MEGLQRKKDPTSNIVVGPEGGPLPAGLHEYVRSSGVTGRPLDATTRGDLERSFDHSLEGIRVVTDDAAARAAESLQARAFTLGDSIWFGRGEYRPDTTEGRHLIAHEVAHSLQDVPHRGRVAADLVIGRSDDPAEREADAAADAAVRGERVSLSPAGAATTVRPLRKQRICTVRSIPRPDQRIVHCGGRDYQVTLTTTTEPSRPETQIWTDAGWNNSVIWLQLNVCRRGTSVT
ncbi:MAG TPA: DUF4157 domain-containing protein, partial [Nitrospiraceae bacterium]|nr:DUF4157 domain-containing protein [Nitrospiraceae bacterium]